MTRLEARELVALNGFPRVRFGARTVRGRTEWLALFREPARVVRRFLDRFRERQALPPECEVSARVDLPSRVDARRDVGWWEHVPEAMLLRAVENSTSRQLQASPPAVPLPAQVEIVKRCVARATAEGLRLPPQIRILWRSGRDGICAGCTDGETIWLSVNAWPRDLERTMFHELQHVHDLATDAWTPIELEQRAIAFAARMMGRP